MKSGRVPFMEPFMLAMIMIMMFHQTRCATESSHDDHCSHSCGDIHNIASPFRLINDPPSCGDSRYNLSCEDNRTLVLELPVESVDPGKGHVMSKKGFPENQKYHVLAINYNNYTIRLVDPNISKEACFSIPKYTFYEGQLYSPAGYNPLYETVIRSGLLYSFSYKVFGDVRFKSTRQLLDTVMFFNCENSVQNSYYIDAAPCVFNGTSCSTNSISSTGHFYSYYYLIDNIKDLHSAQLEKHCRLEQATSVTKGRTNDTKNFEGIYDALIFGFELSWVQSFDKSGSSTCYVDDEDSNRVSCISRCVFQEFGEYQGRCGVFYKILGHLQFFSYRMIAYKYYIVGLLAPRTTLGVSFLVALFIYKWRRRHLSMYDGIEEFLQSHNHLMPIRYTYKDIKKMTKGFRDKLGEGGFGSVYKGKLCSGRFVAVKMLGKSKSNGQDFINEVATIGRIHHVNVVRLIGFCVEGSKRALVYDFMPYGSLDKFIFSRELEERSSLSFSKIFEISLGVARGIEYLHRGCDMQILHFDIKPHNILLDDQFFPKVSDFGLARLCPLDNNIVSLTAARGTIGYIAPELFYKNIGGVSYKADVYSFGMLLMEMANRRKNLNALTENSSQIYFPSWIHDQFSKGNDVTIEGATNEEVETIKKMIIVALWCIQLKPCDRPSMTNVIEMLEGRVECLQMPPKLYLWPQEFHNAEDAGEISETTSSSATSGEEDSAEIRLISNAY